MPRSQLSSLMLISFLAVAFVGCSTDSPSSEQTGSLNLNLELADGITINQVDWTISGGDMAPMSGTIDTSAPGATASVEVFGLPPGDDYLVELEATDESGEVTCRGDAEFDVEVGLSTDVMVMLNCKRPTRLGGVRVNGKFNICAELAKVVVSPLQTSVANDIDLSAQTVDVEGDEVTIVWSATGGSIDDSNAAGTTYTCGEVGDQAITVTVSDDDFEYCMDSWSVRVTCVPGDGGDLCEGVTCDDQNECTNDACDPASGECVSESVEDGTSCAGGDGVCESGECVPADLCEGVDCDDDNECTVDLCDPEDGECSNEPVDDGASCNSGAGMCVNGACMDVDLCADVECDDTGNECTDATCNPDNGNCETSNVADGTPCNDDTGTCSAGVCEEDGGPQEEYAQDFESLDPAATDALSADGWLYFGNVYNSEGGFKFGFGPFAAPTTSGQISRIATGEGGAEQGAQQLVVFSNYDCCQPGEGHFGTDLVETIVFQEINPIPPDFIGRTLTFTFDAKRGNIEGATTAQAFIKTLDPNAGFATTNNVVLDTTSLPADWATYTVVLNLSDPALQGQILQFGFQTVARNFEGAGNFYDNNLATLSPLAP